MKAHVVWSHPRSNSLTGHVVDSVIQQLSSVGFDVDVLDLQRENFDPVLGSEDEPDWDNINKKYSPEVHRLAERAQTSDVIIFVFPVWWYGLPAILKGYLDRVWNQGLLYNSSKSNSIKSVLWVALAGLPQKSFEKRGYKDAIETILNDGVAEFCKIKNSNVLFLYDTIDNGLMHTSSQDLAESINETLQGIS